VRRCSPDEWMLTYDALKQRPLLIDQQPKATAPTAAGRSYWRLQCLFAAMEFQLKCRQNGVNTGSGGAI